MTNYFHGLPDALSDALERYRSSREVRHLALVHFQTHRSATMGCMTLWTNDPTGQREMEDVLTEFYYRNFVTQHVHPQNGVDWNSDVCGYH